MSFLSLVRIAARSRAGCGLKWRFGLAWALLGAQNGDSVWLGLSFDFGGGVEFPLGNPRCRVAGNGRIARGLALEEIRWDAASRFFLSSFCGDEDV